MRTLSIALAAALLAGPAAAQPAADAPRVGHGLLFRIDSARQAFVVSTVYAGNPAADAGLRVDDVLLAANGQAFAGLRPERVNELLGQGTAAAPLQVRIARTRNTSLGRRTDTLTVPLVARALVARTCLGGDCVNGTGKVRKNATGIVYEGRFVNGELVQGKKFYPNGRLHEEGTFVNGALEGEGGTRYFDKPYDPAREPWAAKGSFVKGLLRRGTLYAKDDSYIVTGTWNDSGKLHGDNIVMRGKFNYEGPAVNGTLTGEATRMTYLDGQYSGPVVDGKPEGKGTYTVSCDVYKGNFVNGLMEGEFRVKQADGARRVFRFRGGKQL